MDNDCLFVCFSNEALSDPQGYPPFHDEIKMFAANLDNESFSDFFEGRFKWHWYPIITSGFTSFSIHGDLPDELNDQKILEAIGYAASICAHEDGHRFISGLGLLSLLCRSVDKPQAIHELTFHFMDIRRHVMQNAIDPNIHYWFSKVALYQISTGVVPQGYDGPFDRAGLNAPK